MNEEKIKEITNNLKNQIFDLQEEVTNKTDQILAYRELNEKVSILVKENERLSDLLGEKQIESELETQK